MAFVLQPAPTRAVSVSVSMLAWVGALALLAVGGRHIVPMPPREEGATLTVEWEPPTSPPVTPQMSNDLRATRTENAVDLTVIESPTTADIDSGPAGDALGEFAAPPAVSAPDPVITSPHWLHRPSDLSRYYPGRALERGKTGEVQLECRVGVEGRLSCRIVSVTPDGWGFGEAALRIAAEHQMAPAMENGVPREGRYFMRVPFALDGR